MLAWVREHPIWTGVGAVVVLGASALAMKLCVDSSKREAKRKELLEEAEKWVHGSFQTHKGDILKFFPDTRWGSKFEAYELNKMHERVTQVLETLHLDVEKGVLTFGAFEVLTRDVLHSQHLIKSYDGGVIPIFFALCRMFHLWDIDDDELIDFVELVEGLGQLVFGSKILKINRVFNLYDLNNDHFISRDELQHIFHSFMPGASDEAVNAQVKEMLAETDENSDNKISRQEFQAWALRPEFDIDKGFNRAFVRQFGIELPGAHEHKAEPQFRRQEHSVAATYYSDKAPKVQSVPPVVRAPAAAPAAPAAAQAPATPASK